MEETKQPIIGIVGKQGSGKDSAAKYIAQTFGFVHISLSDIIRDYLDENKLGKETRPLMIEIGNKLRSEHGPDYLAQQALVQAKGKSVVMSSIRNPFELETLHKAGATIIEVRATPELRYSRSVKRQRDGDDITLDEFIKNEKIELASNNQNAQQLMTVISEADMIIENNGTLEELYERIDEVMDTI